MKKLQLKDAGKFFAMLMCALFISFSLSSCHDDDDKLPAQSEILKVWEFDINDVLADDPGGLHSNWKAYVWDLSHQDYLRAYVKINDEWSLAFSIPVEISFNEDGISGTITSGETIYRFRNFTGKSVEFELSGKWHATKASKEKPQATNEK